MSAPQPEPGCFSCFVTAAARRCAAVRVKLAFRAFRQALKDITADIKNVPADYKAQRLLVDGLKRYHPQHDERNRIVRRQEPTDPGGDG